MKLIGISLVAVVSASLVFTSPTRAATLLYYTSSPTSWVGQGLTLTMSPTDGSTFSYSWYSNDLEFSINSPVYSNWTLNLVGPNNTVPTAGLYPNAQRWPFESAGNPGFDFSGDGRGNDNDTGYFDVFQGVYSGTTLQSFAADFLQYGDGGQTDWVRGSIRYNSPIPLVNLPGPVVAWSGSGSSGNWSSSSNWSGTALSSSNTPWFSGTNHLTSNNDFAANTLFTGIVFDGAAGAFTLTGNPLKLGGDILNASPNPQTINLNMALQQGTNFMASAGNLVIRGVISGSNSVTTPGPFATILTATNTYTGATTISGGTLQLGNGTAGYDGSLATSGITDNATLAYNLFGSQTPSYAVGGSGGLTKSGPGTLTLSTSNGYTGTTLVSGGTLFLANPAALAGSTFDSSGGGVLSFGTLTSAGFGGLQGSGNLTINNNTPAAVSLSVGGNNASTTFSGTLVGSGSLTKFGNGTLTLSTSNGYTGTTLVSGGTLFLANPAALAGSTFDSSGGGVLSFGTLTNVLFAGLQGSGNLTINNNTPAAVSLSVGGNNASTTFSGGLSGLGGLIKTGTGTLTLSAFNSFTGGTTVSAGTLQGMTASLQGSITNNATLVFNQAADGTFAGTINGSGGFTKSGSGGLMLSGADTLSSTGSVSITQGTLAAPYGISHGGGAITLTSGAALQAAGQVNRAVTGVGTVSATGDLIIGNSQQTGQFNQGGSPSVGGTLNVGGNAVVVLSADTAILGSQTNIGAGGSLTALNGAQLGNPSSVDSTKILTATGSAQIHAAFINNGLVNGPTGTGQELTFYEAVTGAGSTTGNVEYAASYRPSNSPNAVSVQNVLFDSTSTLIMELAGTLPGSGYDQLDISGLATLNGTLDLTYLDGFSPSADESFEIFNGPTTGKFAQINLPSLSNGLSWDTSNLYTSGAISVAPEPSSLALLAAGAIGLVGYGLRRRLARRTAKPAPIDHDAPVILSFPSHSSPAHAARRAA